MTFEKMLEILIEAHAEKHRRRGRNPKLTMENRLLAALEYWREYRTFSHIAASYGVSESSIFKTIRWIEDILIKDGAFSLPGRKTLLSSETKLETVLIDATETPVERPKRGAKMVLWKKETAFKASGVRLAPWILAKVDTGYLGIKNLHSNSEHPIKRSKYHKLTPAEKKYNRKISSQRVVNEHVIGFLK